MTQTHKFETAPIDHAFGPSKSFIAALASETFAKTPLYMRFMARQTTAHRAAAKRGEIGVRLG